MKLSNLLFCLLPLAFAPAFVTTDAQACGGCIVSPMEQTQVTGHRMILSISKDWTTLWDQIEYDGAPQSFAWVLPIKGTVGLGLSSDALFEALEKETAVTINAPTINCLPANCQVGGGVSISGATGGGGVTVLAREVVGPYAAVQLSSQDPAALQNWLTTNGYNLPADIVPVVSAYVKDGFNFLALKLVPGMGINSMRPIRVTSAGATPVLPLRMVAAGTGLNTPIALWVMGEGRYEPANFGSFTVDSSKLIWDWDTSSSNYAAIVQAQFDASGGKSWLIEAGEPFSTYTLENSLLFTAQYHPEDSGYGLDPMGPSAEEECTADLDALYGSIPNGSLWVTRMRAVLSRPALSNDLNLQASADQKAVSRWLQATNSIGTPPACPPPPAWCNDTSSSASSSGGGEGGSGVKPSASSCAVGPESAMPTTLGLFGAALALSLAHRRARKTRRS